MRRTPVAAKQRGTSENPAQALDSANRRACHRAEHSPALPDLIDRFRHSPRRPIHSDSQRNAALAGLNDAQVNPLATGNFDNLSTTADRSELSRIEVVSGNTVEFQGDSMTIATGGEVVVTAVKRTLVDTGAQLDVSGAIGVRVAMETNNLKINVQGISRCSCNNHLGFVLAGQCLDLVVVNCFFFI